LTAERKATKPPAAYPSKKDITKFIVKASVKGSTPVTGIDSAEDVIILVSREDDGLTGLDFEGRKIFNIDIRGIAKFWNGTDKIFISGKESGLYDLKSADSTYRVTCHEVVNHFSFHPNANLIVTGSHDGSWSLHDVNAGQILVKI